MKRILNTILLSFLLLAWLSYATDWQWTQFWTTDKPIALPMTSFISWWTTSGKYVSGWQIMMQIGESGTNISQLPFNPQKIYFNTGIAGSASPDLVLYRGANSTLYVGSWITNTGANGAIIWGSFTTNTAGSCGIWANLVCPQVNPNGWWVGSIVAHWIRRYTTTVWLDFSFGESITNRGEPWIEVYFLRVKR